jgi:outer membrane receptor protein involved in Fe transport
MLRPLAALLLSVALAPMGLTRAAYAAAQAQPAATVAKPTAAGTPAASVKAAPATDANKPAAEAAVPVPEGTPVQTVSVVAQRQTELIDRSVYDVKTDQVSPSASAADVISNVPNVTVDQDGKVAIRGNQNTRVYVDGKPSAMFSGANGGEALNSYPADAIQRVEVITTPGAEFGSEGGSGPILNLVTARVRRAGGQGSVTAGGGTRGQGNASFNGSYSTGRYQVEGLASYSHRLTPQSGWSDTASQGTNGTPWTTHRTTAGTSRSDYAFLNPKLVYNVGDADRASVGLTANTSRYGNDSGDDYVAYRGSAAPYEAYRQDRQSSSRMTVYTLGFNYEHVFGNDGKIVYDLRTSGNVRTSGSRGRNTYTVLPPTGPRVQSVNDLDTANRQTDFTVDYEQRLKPGVTLKAGMKAGLTRGRSDRDFFYIDPLTGEELANDDQSTAFKSLERTYAVYAAPNFVLSEHWGVVPGLRYERVLGNIDYLSKPGSAAESTRRLLPSLHVRYAWGEKKNSSVTAAYTSRIDRPRLEDLNPNVQHVGEQSYSAGDARLRPTRYETYETKYADAWGWLNTTFSLFHEKNSPLLGRIYAVVPGTTAVLSQAVNFGAKTTDGVSLDFQARPRRGLDMGATLGLRHVNQAYLSTQYDGNHLPYSVESARQANSTDLKLRASVTVDQHMFSTNANYTGRTLFSLIETQPTWQVAVNWSWRIDPRLSLRSGITDIFNSNIRRSSQVSPTYQSRSWNHAQGRMVSVALSYRLGGVTGDPRLRSAVPPMVPAVVPPRPVGGS